MFVDDLAPPDRLPSVTRRTAVPWWRIALLGVLGVLPTALLWPFRNTAFVADDRWFATVPLVDAAAHWLTAPWPHPFGPAHAYRPLVLLTYALTQWYASGTPLAFHLTNLLLHGANAALLAALLWRVSGSWLAGILAGVMFAIHPITHENVVWISGRTYPVAALFGLALLGWTSLDLRAPRWPPWLRHAIGCVLLIAALMSYEMAVTLPLMVAIIRFRMDPGRRPALNAAAERPQDANMAPPLPRPPPPPQSPSQSPSQSHRWRRTMQFTAPYFTVVAAYLLFRWAVVSSFAGDSIVWRHGLNPSPWMMRVHLRMLVNTGALASRLLNADDALFGSWWSLRTSTTLAGAAVVAIATAGVVRSRDRQVHALALGALALAAIAFAPAVVGPAYVDRLTYLTAAGAASFLALGVTAAWRRASQASRITIAACTLTALVCWSVRYQALGAEWQHAGAIAESFLNQLVVVEPAPASHASLHFADVPERIGAAYIYVTYLHHSVRQRYGRDDLEIVAHGDDETIPALVAKLDAADDADDADDATYAGHADGDSVSREVVLFRWDADAERLLPVWRRPPAPRATTHNASH
jgi:hypothetical protein